MEYDIIGELRSESISKVTVSADIDRKKLGVNKSRIGLGSETKIDKFQDLLIICILFMSSTCGVNEFRDIIEKRWRKLRSQPIQPEQTFQLHQDADDKSCSWAQLLSALRFWDSRNKIDKSFLPYILIWIKLMGGWPSIVNGGCRFALQARLKFIDQVRILPKPRTLWNHGRILL